LENHCTQQNGRHSDVNSLFLTEDGEYGILLKKESLLKCTNFLLVFTKKKSKKVVLTILSRFTLH